MYSMCHNQNCSIKKKGWSIGSSISNDALITNFAGDVVTPGFFREFPTTEDIMYRPYGGGEMNMFNFAYNLVTLKFKKANQQLPNDILRRTLRYMNIGKL